MLVRSEPVSFLNDIIDVGVRHQMRTPFVVRILANKTGKV